MTLGRNMDQENRPDVRSFYSLADVDLSQASCQGTACFVARHLNPDAVVQS